MNWKIDLYVRNDEGKLYHPCGTEYTMLYNDLKTLKGVRKRMEKWLPFNMHEKSVLKYKIYAYNDLYNEDTYLLVDNNTLYNYILNKQRQNLIK